MYEGLSERAGVNTMRTFPNGIKVMLDDECEAIVIGYNNDLEAYKLDLGNGRFELAYESQLEEIKE